MHNFPITFNTKTVSRSDDRSRVFPRSPPFKSRSARGGKHRSATLAARPTTTDPFGGLKWNESLSCHLRKIIHQLGRPNHHTPTTRVPFCATNERPQQQMVVVVCVCVSRKEGREDECTEIGGIRSSRCSAMRWKGKSHRQTNRNRCPPLPGPPIRSVNSSVIKSRNRSRGSTF